MRELFLQQHTVGRLLQDISTAPTCARGITENGVLKQQEMEPSLRASTASFSWVTNSGRFPNSLILQQVSCEVMML